MTEEKSKKKVTSKNGNRYYDVIVSLCSVTLHFGVND